MGGGGPAAPFEGQIQFAKPTAGYGALVFIERSEEDGSVWETSIIRVRFA